MADIASWETVSYPFHRLIWQPATLSFLCHWAGSNKAHVEAGRDYRQMLWREPEAHIEGAPAGFPLK